MSPVDTVDASSRTRMGYRYELQTTYRYLRLGIILLGLLLFTGITYQILSDGGAVLPSVSAYYYSPARGIFVGSLCAVGACMIIFRGRSDTEDGLLNMSGYLAFFVAFVPTPRQEAVGTDATAVIPVDLTAAVTNNSWSVLIVGAIGFALQVGVAALSPGRPWHRNPALLLSIAAYTGLLVFFLAARPTYLAVGHYVAALGLFLGVVGVVGVNAVALARARGEAGIGPRERWRNRYTLGFALMVVTIALVLVVLRPRSEHWVFVLEALLIAQFMAFWITQTVERWRVPDPPQDDLVPG
ncbi:MAG: hypothetical protein ACK5LS_09535 [Propioniciclava sp.]